MSLGGFYHAYVELESNPYFVDALVTLEQKHHEFSIAWIHKSFCFYWTKFDQNYPIFFSDRASFDPLKN